MLEFVKTEVKPDILFWTGDNSPHNVWANSNEEVALATMNITKIIQAQFDATNISVYPIQGNHDTWPVNVQDFSQANSNIPINAFHDLWLDWLEPETIANYAKYGYYSQTLKLKDGRVFNTTKLIGINTQACNNMNWELIKNRYDPGNQIAWLENELSGLEAIGG